MNVNARGDDSYCSEHCVAPTRVVGEHGLSGSGRRLAIVTAKRYARWTRPTAGPMSFGPGKVSHIHSTTRFPFRDMATVIEISRSGESTRGHAATPNENYRKLHPTHNFLGVRIARVPRSAVALITIVPTLFFSFVPSAGTLPLFQTL